MIACEVNPPEIAAAFDDGLNRCFPGWGDAAVSRWYFDRGVGGPPADRLVLRRAGELLAGCGLNFRPLRLAAGALTPAAIITSAWTRPEARRRGCFARLLDEAADLARRRGRALVLAFVTAGGASARGLERAGWALFPVSYLVSTAATPRPARRGIAASEPVEVTRSILAELAAARERAAGGRSHVAYPSLDDFASQWVERPRPTRLLRLDEGWALLEEAADTDRMLLLLASDGGRERALAALLDRAQARDRKLFLYADRVELAATAESLGLEAKAGYLGALVADRERLGAACGVERPWTASDSTPLAAPGSPWYLGPWRIDGGDRM